jgi:hypothetical protein
VLLNRPELRPHALPRKVDSLNLEGAPLEWWLNGMHQDVVDPAYILKVRVFLGVGCVNDSLKEVNLVSNYRIRVLQNRFSDPLKDRATLQEPLGADRA